MAIKDILVHMDDTQSCKGRLDAAIQVARTHGAHLIGLYAKPHNEIPGYMDVQIPADLLQMQEERLAAAAASVEKTFESTTKAAVISAEWRCETGNASVLLTDQGRYVDLIVVGQHNIDNSLSGPSDGIADNVVLSSGRPVLVIPINYAGTDIGKRVMVGWDEGQMATRALHDSLPFLAKAEKVSVMVVNPKDDGGNLPGIDVAHHLARHNIQVEADHSTSDELSIGDQLLSRAADMGADLIVSGAYGHSRWKELVLGGVTRQLLETMPVPVLMSH